MDIQDSALYREINAILSSGVKPVHFAWAATVHANGKNIRAMKLREMDIQRDYEVNYSDDIHVLLVFPAGDFWADIYPYHDNLEVTIYKYPLSEVGDAADNSSPVQTERYKAILSIGDNGSPLLENTGANNDTRDTLNLKDFVPVEFQLIDRSLYQMRMMEVGNNFRNCTVEQALRAIMTSESQKVIVDQQRVNQGVEMVPANNQTVRSTVSIPQGTALTDVPAWIHQKCGGVYSAGFGYYLQNNHWYIYPCYDPTRVNKTAPALTIINLPKNRFVGIERTYRLDGSNLVVLATGDVKFRDRSNAMQLNRGNGVRFVAADELIDSWVTVKNGIPIASRGKVTTEVMTTARPDGINNARVSPRAINANPFVEYSDMAARNGSPFALTWENSDPSLITPGMLAVVVYQDGESISQVYGVVLKSHTFVRMQGSGMTSSRHATDTAISIFVQRPLGNGDNTGQGVITLS